MAPGHFKIDYAKAKEMREAGMTYAAIAKEFGVTPPGVFLALNPDKRSDYRIQHITKQTTLKN